MEECGKQSLRPVSYLVPLELDCRHDDNTLRLCPRDPQGNEEDDADAINEDSISAESQRGSNVSADAEGQRFLPDMSYIESAHMSGSSRVSSLANGTTDGCNATNATPTTVPQSLTPTTVVTQTQEGEERDGGEATTTTRPQRRAARQQRALLGRLIKDDLLLIPPAVQDQRRSLGLCGVKGGVGGGVK